MAHRDAVAVGSLEIDADRPVDPNLVGPEAGEAGVGNRVEEEAASDGMGVAFASAVVVGRQLASAQEQVAAAVAPVFVAVPAPLAASLQYFPSSAAAPHNPAQSSAHSQTLPSACAALHSTAAR